MKDRKPTRRERRRDTIDGGNYAVGQLNGKYQTDKKVLKPKNRGQKQSKKKEARSAG